MAFLDADGFGVEDAGPDFDPDLSPEAPEPLEIAPELVADAQEGWLEQQVKDLLITQGNASNWLFRLGPDDETWKHTEDDLRAIAGPLTRILNRYDATRAAAAAGDEIALGSAVFNYAARNYTQRRRLLRYLAEQQVPVSGVPAPEGTGPPPEPDDYEPPFDAPPDLIPRGHR